MGSSVIDPFFILHFRFTSANHVLLEKKIFYAKYHILIEGIFSKEKAVVKRIRVNDRKKEEGRQ
jgi:hypothetical protein